eukprot:TCONS_00000250-protein
MVTFVDRNGVELTVTPSKFEQLKKCGLLPANAGGQPSKVKSNLAKNSHHKKVSEKLAPKMVTFVDRNGMELTVTPSKFEQLKKCGLLPANAGQPSKVKSNLAKYSHHKKASEKLAPKMVTFVDPNGVELTVTPSKFEQLKKCGLLPADADQSSKVESNLAKD